MATAYAKILGSDNIKIEAGTTLTSVAAGDKIIFPAGYFIDKIVIHRTGGSGSDTIVVTDLIAPATLSSEYMVYSRSNLIYPTTSGIYTDTSSCTIGTLTGSGTYKIIFYLTKL